MCRQEGREFGYGHIKLRIAIHIEALSREPDT